MTGAIFLINLIYFAFIIGWCVVWGIVTNKIIENKGYSENWFWWGFFFGIIALIIALTKPDANYMYNNNHSGNSVLSSMAKEREMEEQRRKGYWQCSCGILNPPYCTTCVCGKTPKDISAEKAKAAADAAEEEKLKNLKILKDYKELLDAGIISQEEFEDKKAKLL